MNTQQTRVQRTWTANEERGPGKWLPISLLTILLLITSYLFARYVFVQDVPQTFAVAIAVTQYKGELLPDPAFAAWDLGIDKFPAAGLDPWKVVMDAQPNARSEITQSLRSIDDELLNGEMNPRDTVIVYLRGHTIVHRGQAYFLAGEFERTDLLVQQAPADSAGAEPESLAEDSEILRAALPLAQIFQQLQQLPAANVIVLADICDLPAIPALGVLANNVPELVEQTLAGLDGQRPLWVITATASLQPGHASVLRERSLLQSACEYACDVSRSDKNERFLSLAKFYEAILRYGHHVTAGRQTPLLFRSGVSGKLLDSGLTASVWTEATKVRVARLTERLLPKIPATGEGPASTALLRQPARPQRNSPSARSHLVAAWQAQTAPDNATPASGDSPADEPPPAKVVESDPVLRFWQLHDELEDRSQYPGGWSPVDFAAQAWREMEVAAVDLERLRRLMRGDLSRQASAENELRDLVNELEQLQAAMRSGKSTIGNPSSKLVVAWNALQADLLRGDGKLPWLRPQVLPDREQASWQPIRAGYQRYFDMASQLSGWLDEGLERSDSGRSQLLPPLEQWLQALLALDAKLPTADSTTALAHPLTTIDLNEAQNRLAQLRQLLNRRVQASLSTTRLVAQTGLLWSDERALQQLLHSTNLSYQDRKQLTDAYLGLSKEQLIEPGTNNIVVDKTFSITNLLGDPGTDDARLHYFAWSSILHSALQFAGFDKPGTARWNSLDDLNDWGSTLIAAAERGAAPENPALRWKQACLNDLRLFATTSQFGGALIVPVSNDTTMEVAVPQQLQIPAELICEVKRRNGSPVNRCFLKWELINESELLNSLPQRPGTVLSIISPDSQVLEPGQVHPLPVAGSQVSLELKTDLELSSRNEVIRLRVALSDTSDMETPAWRTIDVSPPNPDRLELYAQLVDPVSNQKTLVLSSNQQFGQQALPVVSGLAVPAVAGQAKQLIELYLANLSAQEKVVEVSLYEVESTQTVGNGQLTSAAVLRTIRDLDKRQPHYVSSAPLVLPKNEQGMRRASGSGPAGGQRIVFKAVPAADGAPAGPKNIGEFGLLCVVEEVVVEGDITRKLDKPVSYHGIECVPEKPDRRLVKVASPAREGAFAVQLAVEAGDWDRWGAEELAVSLQLTDYQGNPLESSGRRSAVLNREESQVTLVATPDQTPNQPVVAHIDIGGYPRATSFQSRLRGGSDMPQSANQSFIWLDEEKLVCASTSAGTETPIPTRPLFDSVVIPAFEGVDGQQDGTPIQLSRITVPLQIDFPKNGLKSTAVVELGGIPVEFTSDRKFLPRFDLKQGNLVFSAATKDLVYEMPVDNYDFSGRRKLEVVVPDEPQSAKSLDLVFDRRPPEKSSVRVEPRDLYVDESIRLSITASDRDSAIREVYFAIDRQNFTAETYDKDDKLPLKAEPFGGQWVASLKASDMPKELPTGESYDIVCRTIDFAGNMQNENERARIRWTGEKRPDNQPKPPAAAPKVSAVTTPPPPTEQTVIIDITVEGKKPAYPEKMSVTGIAGATEARTGGSIILTKVPHGDYTITASYSDAFDVPFEGRGKLKVSASSSRRVTIDVKRVK